MISNITNRFSISALLLSINLLNSSLFENWKYAENYANVMRESIELLLEM